MECSEKSILGVLGRENKQKKQFEEIMAVNVLKLPKDIIHTHEAPLVVRKIHRRKLHLKAPHLKSWN